MAALHPKVTIGTISGLVCALLIVEANKHGLTIDANEAGTITALAAAVAGYFAPSGDDATAPLPSIPPDGGADKSSPDSKSKSTGAS